MSLSWTISGLIRAHVGCEAAVESLGQGIRRDLPRDTTCAANSAPCGPCGPPCVPEIRVAGHGKWTWVNHNQPELDPADSATPSVSASNSRIALLWKLRTNHHSAVACDSHKAGGHWRPNATPVFDHLAIPLDGRVADHGGHPKLHVPRELDRSLVYASCLWWFWGQLGSHQLQHSKIRCS